MLFENTTHVESDQVSSNNTNWGDPSHSMPPPSDAGVARRGPATTAALIGDGSPPACNTGGQNPEIEGRKRALTCDTGVRVLLHGIDTAYWSVSAEAIGGESLGQLIAWCEAATSEGANPAVMPEGVRVKRLGPMPGFQYTINFADGLRIGVPSEAGLHMGLYVMAGAAWCLAHRPEVYEGRIDAALLRLGVNVPASVVRLSRADVRFDLAGVHPWVDASQVVTRAKGHDVHHEGAEFTGVSAGRGDIRFRLYDKVREAAAGGTLARWAYAWGLDAGELVNGDVWRMEYQLRGEVLRQFGIESMADLLARLGDVLAYLLDWFRLAYAQSRKDVDRPLVEWWREVTGAIQALPLAAIGAVRQVLPKLPKPVALWLQLRGVAAAWWAAQAVCEGRNGLFSMAALLRDLMREMNDSRDVLRESYGAKLESYRMAQFA